MKIEACTITNCSLKKRNNMQNIVKVLADTLLVDLFQKESQGANISKNEFDVMMEAYKKRSRT